MMQTRQSKNAKKILREKIQIALGSDRASIVSDSTMRVEEEENGIVGVNGQVIHNYAPRVAAPESA